MICNFRIAKVCRISIACSSLKFELKTFSLKYLVVSNYIVVTITLELHYSCILRKMASLRRKRLLLSEKYKAITEVESGTKPSKVASNVLTWPLITITKRAVKNLDLLKDLHGWRCLQLLNCFKTAVPLRSNRQHFNCKVI